MLIIWGLLNPLSLPDTFFYPLVPLSHHKTSPHTGGFIDLVKALFIPATEVASLPEHLSWVFWLLIAVDKEGEGK